VEISVIIPTLNAEKYIKKQLELLWSQTVKPSEILVVDSSSEDSTVDIARSLGANVYVIPREEFSHGKTRNEAARRAKGEILIFLSQDAVPYNELMIERLIAPLSGRDVVGSYGRHVPRKDSKPTEFVARLINYPDYAMQKDFSLLQSMGAKTFFFSNVCSAVKKDLLFKLGGFPEDVFVAEDFIFAAKALKQGYKVVYVPDAMVIHSHDFGPLEYFKRYYMIGKSLGRYKWVIENDRLGYEGRKILKEQLKFVVREKKFHWIPYVFVENALKYIAFKTGAKFTSTKEDN